MNEVTKDGNPLSIDHESALTQNLSEIKTTQSTLDKYASAAIYNEMKTDKRNDDKDLRGLSADKSCRLRRRQPVEYEDGTSEVDYIPDREHLEENSSRSALIDRFLINDLERDTVALRRAGLTQKKVAEQLGCSARTVRRTVARIKQRILTASRSVTQDA